MKIIILGGSNSLRAGGYPEELVKRFEGTEILNYSLGAAPSSMGLFNLIDKSEISPGDLVIWEYALNDINHINLKGHDESLILRMVEHTIRYCARSGAAFLPVILTPRDVEGVSAPRPYRAMLHFLFHAYGIPFIDFSLRARAKFGVPRIPRDDYDDHDHLMPNGRMFDYLADLIFEEVGSGVKTPERIAPVFLSEDQEVHVIRKFTGGVEKRLVNRLFDIGYVAPDGSPVIVESPEIDGRIVGMVVVSDSKAGVLNVTSGEESLDVSICHNHKNFEKPTIKILTLPNLTKSEFRLGAGRPLVITWAEEGSHFMADFDFKSDLGDGSTIAEVGGVAALLVETGKAPVADARTQREKQLIRNARQTVRGRKMFTNLTKQERIQLRKRLKELRGEKQAKRSRS